MVKLHFSDSVSWQTMDVEEFINTFIYEKKCTGYHTFGINFIVDIQQSDIKKLRCRKLRGTN